MKNILFPTDFSPSADNALKYAVALAQKMQSELILLNVQPVPAYATDMPIDPRMSDELRGQAVLSLRKTEEEISKIASGLTVRHLISEGSNATHEILSAANANKADLIIMGTHGASGFEKFIFGSAVAGVLNKADIPVLAIPDECTFKSFANIAFATEGRAEEIPAIKEASNWAKKFDSAFSLVHITEGVLFGKLEQTILEKFGDTLRMEFDIPIANIDIKKSGDFVEGISQYITEKHPNLLIMAHRKRTFFDQLTDPSISRKLTFKLTCPLLTLPISGF